MNNALNNSDRIFLYKRWDKQLFTHTLDVGSISLMPKPPGGIELPEFIGFLKDKKIDILVSLLQFREVQNFGLINEASECRDQGIEFINFPIMDHDVPQFITPFNQLIEVLTLAIKNDKNIAVHCYAGIGRTGLVASSILIKLGMQVDFSLINLSRTRGTRVPETLNQISWLHRNHEHLSHFQGSN